MSEPLHVVCPHCHTTNRVKADQLSSAPTCGQCKQPLFTGHPVALDDEAAFDKHVTRSQIPVLVDFWAPWCGPCKMIAPALDDLAGTYAGRAKIVKVDVDQNQATALKYHVRSIPMLLLFKGGQVQATQIGAVGKGQLAQMIEKSL